MILALLCRRLPRIGVALLISFLFLLLTLPLSGQNDDPSEIFLKAYLSAQQGEKLEHENRFKTALAKFRFAGSLIEELRKSHPDWQSAIVEYRGRRIGEGILRVQERISRHNELTASASPLPELVPSLPENDAWSEPGPEVVAPQRFAASSEESIDAAIEKATGKLRHKVDQLQAALEKSRSDIETGRKEKDAVNAHLQEATSRLESAQKEIEKSKQSERQLRDQLERQRDDADSKLDEAKEQIAAVTRQRDAALAQSKGADEKEHHTISAVAENGGFQQNQANAEKPPLGNDNSTNTEELVGVKQQVSELQQHLTDSQKQNQYLVARISELWVQLDETGAQLQNAKLSGKNSEETDRLVRENELLRNIVVRERQEEARRDEARKLILAELDKLPIKSDALNNEIAILAQPVTKLSSQELSLLRQPVVSVSDQNRGALTASLIFAKQPAGSSADREAATNNSGELKEDGHDNRQSVAHTAKENLGGVNIGPEKAISEGPGQGSE
jgi:chromosome segregation ATPase